MKLKDIENKDLQTTWSLLYCGSENYENISFILELKKVIFDKLYNYDKSHNIIIKTINKTRPYSIPIIVELRSYET
jgi:hypothetical protein